MSITLYAKPNYEEEILTFDPSTAKYVLYLDIKNSGPFFKVMTTEIKFGDRYHNQFTTGYDVKSVKNESKEYYLLIVDFYEQMYMVQGSVKDINIHYFNGYIKIVKYPKDYKIEMIIFISLFILIIVVFSCLFFTGFVKLHKTIEYF